MGVVSTVVRAAPRALVLSGVLAGGWLLFSTTSATASEVGTARAPGLVQAVGDTVATTVEAVKPVVAPEPVAPRPTAPAPTRPAPSKPAATKPTPAKPAVVEPAAPSKDPARTVVAGVHEIASETTALVDTVAAAVATIPAATAPVLEVVDTALDTSLGLPLVDLVDSVGEVVPALPEVAVPAPPAVDEAELPSAPVVMPTPGTTRAPAEASEEGVLRPSVSDPRAVPADVAGPVRARTSSTSTYGGFDPSPSPLPPTPAPASAPAAAGSAAAGQRDGAPSSAVLDEHGDLLRPGTAPGTRDEAARVPVAPTGLPGFCPD